ncbi:hypothetical protein GCM10022236_09850 [Microlunatus ginsengisoli]|uniref:Uncharacterized protein n=1 Tax=Microlunatus ginsengisoli TaxID=363863 RepID=A0ABP6ZIB5_9ACTN
MDLDEDRQLQRLSPEPTPVPIDPLRAQARAFLAPYRAGIVWDVDGIADALVARLAAPVKEYAFVRAVIAALPSAIEDNVTADVVNRLPVPVSVIGLSSEGRAMLDVFYDAMITGDVSKFEREQANKIISYRMGRVSQAEFVAGMDRRMIFPIRNIGVTRLASATFTAELQTNGKIGLHYNSVVVTQYDMFKADLATLPSWSQLSNGIELDPNLMVAVHLFDVEDHPIYDVPALALIDYSNQIKERTLGTAKSAFMLGLTVGLGGLGGGSLEGLQERVLAGEVSKAYLWGARALVWADRVQFGIQAGAMVVNDHRDWIVDTFPDAGPHLLDAMDTANRLAGYYGWARLGVDGLRLVRAKLGPAADGWRSARATAKLGGDQAKLARAVEDEADTLLAELQYAEEKAASGGDRGSVSPPIASKAKKSVAGGEKEIHVTENRIEICPVQRCPDLDEVVGSGSTDPTVAKEIADAKSAAKAGDAAGAARLAEEAIIDAGVATSPAKGAPTTRAAAAAKGAPRGKVSATGAPAGSPLTPADVAARGYPLGFPRRQQFVYFGWSGKAYLEVRAVRDAELGIQGSAVTVRGASSGKPFDDGRLSDIDLAVISPTLAGKARAAGIPVRDGHTRFALSPDQATTLGIPDLGPRLSRFLDRGRPVNIMVFESRAAALAKEPWTMWVWW